MSAPADLLPDWLDEHARRVAQHDPLARVQPADLQPGTRLLVADGPARGDAVALLHLGEVDQTTTMALWVAPRVLRVRVRARTDAAAAAALPLLRRAVAEAPEGVEVHVTAPSRDLPLLRPLLDAGFAAATSSEEGTAGTCRPHPGKHLFTQEVSWVKRCFPR